MKKLSKLVPTAAVLVGLFGCNRTSQNGAQPPPAPTATTITLSVDADNPDITSQQTLDFVLPGAHPGEKYWVRFPNKNPCMPENSTGDGQTYSGSYEHHPTCDTKKKANPHGTYVFTWGSGTPTIAAPPDAVPFSAVKCRPTCP